MKSRLRFVLCLLAVMPALQSTVADDTVPSQGQLPAGMPHTGNIIAISPMAGWNRDTLSVPSREGSATQMRDGQPEYGLFAIYVTPRLAINNMAFYTDPNGGDVAGDVLSVTAYGRPESQVTWSAGGSYTWHEIGLPTGDLTIQIPLAKAGVMFRPSGWPLTINPYAGYGVEMVETAHGDADSDILLYGASFNAFLRRLHVNMKYYVIDDLDADRAYETASLRFIMPCFRHAGWLLWGQYMEQASTEDVSVLTGPVFLF